MPGTASGLRSAERPPGHPVPASCNSVMLGVLSPGLGIVAVRCFGHSAGPAGERAHAIATVCGRQAYDRQSVPMMPEGGLPQSGPVRRPTATPPAGSAQEDGSSGWARRTGSADGSSRRVLRKLSGTGRSGSRPEGSRLDLVHGSAPRRGAVRREIGDGSLSGVGRGGCRSVLYARRPHGGMGTSDWAVGPFFVFVSWTTRRSAASGMRGPVPRAGRRPRAAGADTTGERPDIYRWL